MTDKAKPDADAEAFLRELVEAAVNDGATLVDFERVPEGLEIAFMFGNSGIGQVIDDRQLEGALFRFVEKRAKRRKRGDSLELSVHGKPMAIGVEWYDSFGETCFRLLLKEDAGRPRSGEFDDEFDDEFDGAEFDGMEFSDHSAECAGCDTYGPVDDQGLCAECSQKLERDLIRLRDWDYTGACYGLPVDQREPLRARVIEEFGSALELIADPGKAESKSKRAKQKKKRKRRPKPGRKRHK